MFIGRAMFIIGSTSNIVHAIFFLFVLNYYFLAYSFTQIVVLIDKNNLCKFRCHSSKFEKISFLIDSTRNMVHVTYFLLVLNFEFLVYSFAQIVIIIDKFNMCKFQSYSSKINLNAIYIRAAPVTFSMLQFSCLCLVSNFSLGSYWYSY